MEQWYNYYENIPVAVILIILLRECEGEGGVKVDVRRLVRPGVAVPRLVELSVLRVPAVPAPHLVLHLTALHLAALAPAGELGLGETDVGRQDETPGTHHEDGEQGRDVGQEDAGQELSLETEEVEHQDVGHHDQGAAQHDELGHADQEPG